MEQWNEEWLASRDAYRVEMFGETIEALHPPDVTEAIDASEEAVSLAALARNTFHRPYGNAETFARSELAGSIDEILDCQDELARAGRDDVLFAFIGDEQKQIVKTLTAQVVWHWEVASKKHNQASPFSDLPAFDVIPEDLERKDVQLVLEAASAVSHVLASGVMPINNETMQSRISGLVAKQGPAFIEAWSNGQILEAVTDRLGLSSADMPVINDSSMANILRNTARDPVSGLEKTVETLKSTLSTEGIMAVTGWSKALTLELITNTQKMYLVTNYRDSGEKLRQTAQLLETTFNSNNLALRYGWETSYAEQVFSKSFCLKAVLQAKEPMQKMDEIAGRLASVRPERIAEHLGWTSEQVDSVFSAATLIWLAKSYKDPMENIRRIAANRVVMDTEYLATQLQRSPEFIDNLFTTSIRVELSHRQQPLTRARQCIEIASDLIRDHGLPMSAVRIMARIYSPEGARQKARQIELAQEQRPAGISANEWVFAIIDLPDDSSDETRIQHVADYRLMRNIQSPMSLDLGGISDRSMHEQYGSSEYDPGEMLEADSNMVEHLESIAERAGITDQQLNAILEHFASDADVPMDASLHKVLLRLQQAGLQP